MLGEVCTQRCEKCELRCGTCAHGAVRGVSREDVESVHRALREVCAEKMWKVCIRHGGKCVEERCGKCVHSAVWKCMQKICGKRVYDAVESVCRGDVESVYRNTMGRVCLCQGDVEKECR